MIHFLYCILFLFLLDVGHGYRPTVYSLEDIKNQQVERSNVSLEKQMISEKDLPVKQISAIEDQITPKNYVTNQPLIVAKVDKRKYEPFGKSIFKAVKRKKY